MGLPPDRVRLSFCHTESLERAMASGRYTDWDLVIAVAEAGSIADVCRQVGLKPVGGNYRTIRGRIEGLGLSIAHFQGQGWRKGSHEPTTPPPPLKDVLVDGRYRQSNGLKRRLLREGVFSASCSICSREEWNEQTIPLELDHINGRYDDNRIENLRLVCPNCHAQTDTYRGRNIGRRTVAG